MGLDPIGLLSGSTCACKVLFIGFGRLLSGAAGGGAPSEGYGGGPPWTSVWEHQGVGGFLYIGLRQAPIWGGWGGFSYQGVWDWTPLDSSLGAPVCVRFYIYTLGSGRLLSGAAGGGTPIKVYGF